MQNQIQQTEISQDERLRVIYDMIGRAKNQIGSNYRYYLLWGYLVLAASMSEFILIRVFRYELHYLVWPILMGTGVMVSFIWGAMEGQRQRYKSFIGSSMQYLWAGWLVSLFSFLLFFTIRGEHEMILPVSLVMYGLGIFASGGLVNYRLLIYLAPVAWAGAILAFFQPYIYQLPVMAGVVLVTYIVPGHLLRHSFNKQMK